MPLIDLIITPSWLASPRLQREGRPYALAIALLADTVAYELRQSSICHTLDVECERALADDQQRAIAGGWKSPSHRYRRACDYLDEVAAYHLFDPFWTHITLLARRHKTSQSEVIAALEFLERGQLVTIHNRESDHPYVPDLSHPLNQCDIDGFCFFSPPEETGYCFHPGYIISEGGEPPVPFNAEDELPIAIRLVTPTLASVMLPSVMPPDFVFPGPALTPASDLELHRFLRGLAEGQWRRERGQGPTSRGGMA